MFHRWLNVTFWIQRENLWVVFTWRLWILTATLNSSLLLLPERVPKVGRDGGCCSLTLCVLNTMWLQAAGRHFSLWAALPLCSGVPAAVEVVREELCFPVFLKPLTWVKFIIKKVTRSFRLSCTWFFYIDHHFLFGKAFSFWKISYAERYKIIYRGVLLLKLTRIE